MYFMIGFMKLKDWYFLGHFGSSVFARAEWVILKSFGDYLLIEHGMIRILIRAKER